MEEISECNCYLYGSHVSVDVTPYRLCSITMRVCSGASISNSSERHICFSNGPLPTITPNIVVVVVGVLVVIVEVEVDVDVLVDVDVEEDRHETNGLYLIVESSCAALSEMLKKNTSSK